MEDGHLEVIKMDFCADQQILLNWFYLLLPKHPNVLALVSVHVFYVSLWAKRFLNYLTDFNETYFAHMTAISNKSEEVEVLTAWCSEDHLNLNTRGKEIISHFRMSRPALHLDLSINKKEVELVTDFKLLSAHVCQRTWAGQLTPLTLSKDPEEQL